MRSGRVTPHKRAVCGGQWAVCGGQWAVCGGQWAVCGGRWVAFSFFLNRYKYFCASLLLLPSAFCLLLTALPLTAHAHCLLSTLHCSLLTAHFVSHKFLPQTIFHSPNRDRCGREFQSLARMDQLPRRPIHLAPKRLTATTRLTCARDRQHK